MEKLVRVCLSAHLGAQARIPERISCHRQPFARTSPSTSRAPVALVLVETTSTSSTASATRMSSTTSSTRISSVTSASSDY